MIFIKEFSALRVSYYSFKRIQTTYGNKQSNSDMIIIEGIGESGHHEPFFRFFNPLSSQDVTELFFVWQMTAVEKGNFLA